MVSSHDKPLTINNKPVKSQLGQIKTDALGEIKNVSDSEALESLRVKYLGRKGELSLLLRGIKDLSDEEKREIGPLGNKIREEIEQAIKLKTQNSKLKTFEDIAQKEKIDVTEPGEKLRHGTIHPITQVTWEIQDIFKSMGFEIVDTPEIDTDYYNFEVLNIPKDHPARTMWDTFYLENGLVPRVHTSTAQGRLMEKRKPPIRAVNIGRCFRNERTDARHEHTFYQVDGFMLDKNISISNLMATLSEFFKQLFKKDVKVRFRPGYFPFVEPGLEVEAECVLCGKKGCSVCHGTGWLELMGCGMIHPNVIRNGGLDPEKYNGFAFGGGVDRIVMLRSNIKDIRYFQSGDLRFLNQF